MPANRLREEPCGGLLIALFRQQTIDHLAGLIHRTIERAPLAFDPDVRLIHPLVAPHRAFAVVERGFEWQAILPHPPVDRGMIHLGPADRSA